MSYLLIIVGLIGLVCSIAIGRHAWTRSKELDREIAELRAK